MSVFTFYVASYIHRIEPTPAIIMNSSFCVSTFLYTLCQVGWWAIAKSKQVVVGCIGFGLCFVFSCVCALWDSYFFFFPFSEFFFGSFAMGRYEGRGWDEQGRGGEGRGESSLFFGLFGLDLIWIELNVHSFFFF